MPSFTINYYRDAKNKAPVKEFIDGLHDPKHTIRKRIFTYLKLLKEQGYLPFPMGRNIEGVAKLKEMRLHISGNYYRIFHYTAKAGKIVLLHGVLKKTKKTPVQDLELAQKRMKDYLKQLKIKVKEKP